MPYPHITCRDGFTLSVQAGRWTYCEPRTDEGSWTHVEVGFPSEREELLMEYAESPDSPTETVYGYVPVELVQQVILKHGGTDQTQTALTDHLLGLDCSHTNDGETKMFPTFQTTLFIDQRSLGTAFDRTKVTRNPRRGQYLQLSWIRGKSRFIGTTPHGEPLFYNRPGDWKGFAQACRAFDRAYKRG